MGRVVDRINKGIVGRIVVCIVNRISDGLRDWIFRSLVIIGVIGKMDGVVIFIVREFVDGVGGKIVEWIVCLFGPIFGRWGCVLGRCMYCEIHCVLGRGLDWGVYGGLGSGK